MITPNLKLVPAAVEWNNYGGLGAYVRYHRKGSEPRVISSRSSHLHLQLRDRELLLVKSLNYDPPQAFFGGWDKFVPLSMFHEPATVSPIHPQTYMINAVKSRDPRQWPNLRVSKSQRENRIFTIYGDSGGFQLSEEIDRFIDPVEICEFYNTNVDRGMVLDFPLLGAEDYGNFINSAKIQNRNIAIMLKNIRPEVELINVVRSDYAAWRSDFLDIVHHPKIKSLAITKSYHDSGVPSFIDGILKLIGIAEAKAPGHYRHLHVLGLAENLLYIPLMRAQAQGLIPGDWELTMDASTALHKGYAGKYFSHLHAYQGPSYLLVGDDNNVMNSSMRPPCSCPVCSTVGWMDVFALTHIGRRLIALHNIYAQHSYVEWCRELVSELDTESLVDVTERMFRGDSSKVTEARRAVRFVDCAAAEGVEAARSRFAMYVAEDAIETAVDMWGNDVVDEDAEYDKERIGRYNEMFAKYISNLKPGLH